MFHENFVILGFLLSFIGGISYLKDTITGRVQPHRVSWFIWALAPLIAFLAEIKEGVGMQSLMTFSVGFSPLLIFIASFFNKKSDWKYTTFDIWCGILSVVGIVLWLITANAVLAIIFSILSDLIASVPTLIKSWNAPQSENHLPFTFSAMNALITLATIKSWTFVHYAFPVYIFLICLAFSLLIICKPGLKIIKR